VILECLSLLTQKAKWVPRAPPGMRIYAVGDIHGRFDLLTQLVSLIETDLRTHSITRALIVFLGDYIDRGPDSKGVLEVLSSSHFPAPTIHLRGNHEAMLLAFLSRKQLGHLWLHSGGIQTLRSYGIDVSRLGTEHGMNEAASQLEAALPRPHRVLLESLPLYFSAGDYLFCHAGIRPGISYEQQREEDLLWVREEFLKSRKRHQKFIVHGHTPTPEPEIRTNRINIDTGAYMSGRLTCLALEDASARFIVADRTCK
jgi:serine/threonine protein phosphatase 1